MIIFVRFTGTRVGSFWYQAPGAQRYAFGQNPTHRLQGVLAEDWPALKAKFGAWLLEVPADKARSNMVLEAPVATADLPELDRATKGALIDAGLDTLGMVLAEDAARLEQILPGRAESVWNAVAVRVGLVDSPEVNTGAVDGPEEARKANTPMQDVAPAVAAPSKPTQALAKKRKGK